VEGAGADLLRLRAVLSSGRVPEPNSKGLAVYRQRFREALSNDFDTPAALAVLWDGLRPGALSPGSQAALVQEAGEALGLPL
jgi:cysteinyl-tRNA synthetase